MWDTHAMRTTIDIPDETYRELEIKAARQGQSVRQLVLLSIQRDLSETAPRKVQKMELPVIRSSNPGSLNLTNEMIDDILFS